MCVVWWVYVWCVGMVCVCGVYVSLVRGVCVSVCVVCVCV